MPRSATSSIRRGYLGLAGRQIHYRVAGDGPVLILLHPTPESSLFFMPALRSLAAERRVIAFDTPGYGQSDRPDPPFTTVEEYAAAFLGAIDALGIDRFAIGGHLTGSVFATEIAASDPERVTALVVSEAFNWRSASRRAVHEQLHRYYEYDPAGRYLMDLWNRYRPGIDEGLPVEAIAEQALHLLLVNAPCPAYGHMGWEGAAPDAMTRYPFWERAAAVRAPTLVLHGGESVLRRAHDRMLATFPRARGKLVPGIKSIWATTIPRGLPIDAPETYANLVLTFLREEA